jgi:PAS domain S-box-containing protein
MNQNKELTVFLVEDNEHDVIAFKRSLKKSEFSFYLQYVDTAEEAMSTILASKNTIDIIVIDYHLPGLSGFDFFQKLKETGIDIPIVMMTGEGTEELAVKALKTGIDDYVVKDPGHGYLQLIPLLLHEVVKRSNNRRARIAAEQALQESEARYRAIVSDQTEVVSRFGVDGIFTFVNDAVTNNFGIKKEDIIGTSFYNFLSPDEAQKLKSELSQLTIETPLQMNVNPIHLASGEILWYEWANRAIFDHNGKIVEFQGVGRNVTDRVLAEQEKEKLINELQTAIEQVKTLSGLLPICANCKKIRDDEGYWQQVDVYIRDHTEVEFTHGICPPCLDTLYPKYAKERQKELDSEREELELDN